MYMMNQSSGIRNRSFLLPRVSFVAVMFLLATLASSSVAQQMANAPQLGTISGAVYRATNNDIVRGVLITLEAQDGTTTNYRAFTDNDGHFTVRAVRAGKYVVNARKPGFAFQYYGEGASPTVLSLKEAEQLRDINLRLFEPGVISGHVTNEDGDPVPDAEVSAYASRQLRSSRKLVPVTKTKTDDRGDFRLAGLQPGQYVVKVAPVDPLSSAASSRDIKTYVDQVPAAGYVPTYYPGVGEIQEAVPLVLKWAQEIPITISVTRSATYSVSGRAAGPVDSSITILLRQAHAAGLTNAYEGSLTRDGRFTFQHVAPGDYLLLASSRASGIHYSARQLVQVRTANVSHLMIPLEPPFSLSGRVTFDAPINEKFMFAVQAIPTDDDGTGGFLSPVNDNGTFRIGSIAAGTYTIRTTGLPGDLYLKSAALGREDASDEIALTRDKATQPLELVISSAGGRVAGVVLDRDNHAVSGAQVVVLSEKSSGIWDPERGYVTADQDGKFTARGLPPGSYRVLAWRSGVVDRAPDADTAQRASASGKALKVEPNGVYQVNVTVLDEMASDRR
jgi:protocatechuate 3,4-dioxygenase beta subunit